MRILAIYTFSVRFDEFGRETSDKVEENNKILKVIDTGEDFFKHSVFGQIEQ